MDADWAVEMSADDPALEFPWTDPEGKVQFVDLRAHPDQIELLRETVTEPELASALRILNSPDSIFSTAKCDLWMDDDPADDEAYGPIKIGSYIDCVLGEYDAVLRTNFGWHAALAKQAAAIADGEDVPGVIEYIVRRCYYHPAGRRADEDYFLVPGHCVTMYASGFGATAAAAREQWALALQLGCDALMHASRPG